MGTTLTKPEFTIDNYSDEKPINFYSNRPVFEQNAWFAFSQVFKMQ